MPEIIKIDPINPSEGHINKVVLILKNGGVIGYPTETVYGLGADATVPSGINKIFSLKKRDTDKPISIMVPDKSFIYRVAEKVSDKAQILIEKFLPGPVTLIFNISQEGRRILALPHPTVGIRIPDHPVCSALLRIGSIPITCTSANLSGYVSATSAREVLSFFGNSIDLILDGGKSTTSRLSTVLDLTADEPRILRHGRVSEEQILSALKNQLMDTFNILFICTGNSCRSPMAEAYMQKMAKEKNMKNLLVTSAGIAAAEGFPPTEYARAAALEHGVNIENHRSRAVDRHDIMQADLILTHTKEHKDYILWQFPEAGGKTFRLKEYERNLSDDEPGDIEDPIGRDLLFYRQVFREIRSEIERIFPGIESMILKKMKR
ncbi:MAG: L-threonylcarbamoyladenylate synthase [Fidelibacterota bacterium]